MAERVLRILLLALALWAGPASAGDGTIPDGPNWSFQGIFGRYDRAALRRGYAVFVTTCWTCHGIRQIHFRDLEGVGYSAEEVRRLASRFQVPAGPDPEGYIADADGIPFMRDALPADRFAEPYLNDNEARAENGGILPPDLSLIVRARRHGPDYLFAFLTGYQNPPPGLELAPGRHYNRTFPGGQIAMEPPLFDDQVSYDDGTPQTVPQYAKDVTAFLAWTADPHMEARKRIGAGAVLFLALFAALGVLHHMRIRRRALSD